LVTGLTVLFAQQTNQLSSTSGIDSTTGIPELICSSISVQADFCLTFAALDQQFTKQMFTLKRDLFAKVKWLS